MKERVENINHRSLNTSTGFQKSVYLSTYAYIREVCVRVTLEVNPNMIVSSQISRRGKASGWII